MGEICDRPAMRDREDTPIRLHTCQNDPMKLTRILLAAAGVALLTGCMSVTERRYADESRCAGYGFRPGSDAFAKCLQNIDLDRSADSRAFMYGARGPGVGVGFGYGFRRW